VAQATGRGDVVLHAQPVIGVHNPDTLLYRECLVRICRLRTHQLVYPGRFIPALERTGDIQQLDRHVVTMGTDILRTRDDLCLGVNVSAQSAHLGAWWDGIFEQLEGSPLVARRLVIEITETAPMRREAGRAFAARAHAVGCRIAVDDFDSGHGRETASALGYCDFVKISARRLSEATASAEGRHVLSQLVSHALGITQDVIIEGVESPEGVEIAEASGARWMQGFYLGPPVPLWGGMYRSGDEAARFCHGAGTT
jgi:EAL domain-containing protein (putative c-di-GMP-specific phosphodiesterase class I)